jgi:hypothetical protein
MKNSHIHANPIPFLPLSHKKALPLRGNLNWKINETIPSYIVVRGDGD